VPGALLDAFGAMTVVLGLTRVEDDGIASAAALSTDDRDWTHATADAMTHVLVQAAQALAATPIPKRRRLVLAAARARRHPPLHGNRRDPSEARASRRTPPTRRRAGTWCS
jgi:hypothetical protein